MNRSFEQILMDERAAEQEHDGFLEDARTRRQVHVVDELVLLPEQPQHIVVEQPRFVERCDRQDRRNLSIRVRVTPRPHRLGHEATRVTRQHPESLKVKRGLKDTPASDTGWLVLRRRLRKRHHERHGAEDVALGDVLRAKVEVVRLIVRTLPLRHRLLPLSAAGAPAPEGRNIGPRRLRSAP